MVVPFPEPVELRRTVRILNREGLHARPCGCIVSAAQPFQSEVRIRLGPREVNGKSVLELMTLQASAGTELELRVWGTDAEATIAALEDLFGAGFGEELER